MAAKSKKILFIHPDTCFTLQGTIFSQIFKAIATKFTNYFKRYYTCLAIKKYENISHSAINPKKR